MTNGLAAAAVQPDVAAGQHGAAAGMATFTTTNDVASAVSAGSHAADISQAVSAGTHAQQEGSQTGVAAGGGADVSHQVDVASHAVGTSMDAFATVQANNAVPAGWAALAANASSGGAAAASTVTIVTERNYTLSPTCKYPQVRYYVKDACLPEAGEFVSHSCGDNGGNQTWSVRDLYPSLTSCQRSLDPDLFFADSTNCTDAAPTCEDVPATEVAVLAAYSDSACQQEPTAMILRHGCHPFDSVYLDLTCVNSTATFRFYTDPQCTIFISIESLQGAARAAVMAAEGLPEKTSFDVTNSCTNVTATASLMMQNFSYFRLESCSWDSSLAATFAALKMGQPVPSPSPLPSAGTETTPTVDVPSGAPLTPIAQLDSP